MVSLSHIYVFIFNVGGMGSSLVLKNRVKYVFGPWTFSEFWN